MTITYGEKWFDYKKRLTVAWPESRARRAHERRRLYTAVISENGTPFYFVELNMAYVGVAFLDELIREYLVYQFQELEPGRLFLSMATYRDFDGDSDRVKDGTTYYFKPNGTVITEHLDCATNTLTTKECVRDLSGNWEPYPAFGEYSALARKER
ncbi:MAG: lytic transglycosylase [Planctomycetes bacterium]|nr:lytic transglycosylase [Planctomycetota bacterium]